MTEATEHHDVLGMSLRQQSLEKELSLLKDTVWRLTGRIFVLESFLSEKFDELVVDFGLKLSLSAGGHANFLAQAMSAEASVVKLGAGMGGAHHGHEDMHVSAEEPSPPPVGANITIEEHHEPHSSHHNGGGIKMQPRGRANPGVSLTISSPLGRESRHAHRFLYKRDPAPMETRNCSHTPDEEEEDVQYHPHSQPDFNVEEFVVFPHVPEFILGQEVQNGSALMSGANSEDSNTSEHGHPSAMSSPDPPPHQHSYPRRNPRYKCLPCSKLFTSEWHLKAHLVKHSDSSLITTSTGLAVSQGASAGSTNIQGSPPGNLLSLSVQQTIISSPNLGQDSTSSTTNSLSDCGLGAVKPFGCVYCGKRFKKRQELTVHLRTHTGEKPFKCPVCDRGFSQSSSMKTHLRIHTGEKPFKCRLCKSCFTVMHNYKKHLQTAHQIDDFS